MLENLFGSKTRVKLLNLFLNNSDGCFYVREIARDLKENINSIRREVMNLEKIGIIKVVPNDELDINEEERKKNKKEKRRYYRADKDFTLYNELKDLMMKSKLLVDKDVINKIKELSGIKLLVLSGVFVDDKRARADILVVGNVDKNKLRKLVANMERNFENPLRYSMMSQKEFNYRNAMTDKFLFEVMEGKKIVVIDKMNE